MSFDYDIFISYGHVDDEDPARDVKGWVDLLVERLPGVMVGYLGYKPRISREFSPDVVPAKDQRYWAALRRLAWDIANMLAALKQEPSAQQPGAPAARATTPATVTGQAGVAARPPAASAAPQDVSPPVAA